MTLQRTMTYTHTHTLSKENKNQINIPTIATYHKPRHSWLSGALLAWQKQAGAFMLQATDLAVTVFGRCILQLKIQDGIMDMLIYWLG